MNERQFLDRVLPKSNGIYFAATRRPEQGFSQKSFKSIEELYTYGSLPQQQKSDTYFATGTFNGKRQAEHTQLKRTLYLDLDCGEGKPYANRAHAGQALKEFCSASGIYPPNVIVDSGNGLHVYWAFDRDVSLSEWQPLAEGLKNLCEVHGLEADPTCTADAARILRFPGTLNHRDTSNPKPVRIMALGLPYSVSKITEQLDVHATPRPASSPALTLLSGFAGEYDLEHATTNKYYASNFIDKCEIFKGAVESGGEFHGEYIWQHLLNVLAFTDDGKNYIHDISRLHKGYTHNATEKKFAHKLGVVDRGGPTLCNTFFAIEPESCKKCPFRGKVKSPLHITEPKDPDGLPYGYARDDDGMYVITVEKSEDGPDTITRNLVFSYAITDFKLYQAPDAADGFIFKFSASKFGIKKAVTFNTRELMDKRAFYPCINGCGISMHAHQYMEVVRLMTSWSQKMVETKQVQVATPALGWVEASATPGFTLIDKTIFKGGLSKTATFTDSEFVRDFTPVGNKEEWIELSHYLTSENRHAVTAGILSAFAAPLIKFTGVNGCVLALVSGKSGTGKTTALRCAQAVWGDPRRGVNALDDTPLSVANRMGKLKNLPAFWDELRMQDQVQKFVTLMFQVSQGKERSRLTSSIQTRHVGTWNTLITVASNESIADHIRNMVHGTDAGLLRIFEVEVPKLIATSDIDLLQSSIDSNFGHIGREYADWMVNNVPAITATLLKTKAVLTEKTKANSAERFWMATATSLLSAAIFASQLGYVKIDISEFTKWLVEEFKNNRTAQVHDFDPVEVRAKQLAYDFYDEFKDSFAVFDHLADRGRSPGTPWHIDIRGEVLGVYAKLDNKLRIKRSKFSWWLINTRKEGPTKIIQTLIDQGVVEKKARLTSGFPNMADHERTLVLDIELDQTQATEIKTFEVD